MQVYTEQSLPSQDNVTPYAYCVDLRGEWFVQKGAMIAHYGQVRFSAVTAFAGTHAYVAARFSSPLYVQDWVVAEGTGKVLLADRGFDVNSFALEAGNLTVRARNLLDFAPELDLKQSIVPGFVTLLGTGTFLAASNGPVIFVEPPFRADPEALLGWADCPSPAVHHDTAWMAASLAGALQGAFGRASGEERQYDFTGAGTVLLQSSEMVREDPSLLRAVEQQTEALTAQQAGVLGARLTTRAQQARQGS